LIKLSDLIWILLWS